MAMRVRLGWLVVLLTLPACGAAARPATRKTSRPPYAQGCRGLPTGRQHFVIPVSSPPPSAWLARRMQTAQFICAHWGAPLSVRRTAAGNIAWRYRALTLVFKADRLIGLRQNDSRTLTTVAINGR